MKRILSFIFLYFSLLFYFSHQATISVPPLFPHQDKVFHFILYGPLGILLRLLYNRLSSIIITMTINLNLGNTELINSRKNFFPLTIYLLAFGLFYGIFDESHQFFVMGRSSDILDVLADFVGIATGFFLGKSFAGILKGLLKRTKKKND